MGEFRAGRGHILSPVSLEPFSAASTRGKNRLGEFPLLLFLDGELSLRFREFSPELGGPPRGRSPFPSALQPPA